AGTGSGRRTDSVVCTASCSIAALRTLSAAAVSSVSIPTPCISARSNALLLTVLSYLFVLFVAWEYRRGFGNRGARGQLVIPGGIGACPGTGDIGFAGVTGGCNAQGIKQVGA